MEAPRVKDFLIVIISFSVLTFLSWLIDALHKNKQVKVINNETIHAKAASKNAADSSTVRALRFHDFHRPSDSPDKRIK